MKTPRPFSLEQTRRQFLKQSGALAASTAVWGASPQGVFAAGSDALRIGLIGCGNRGTGAALDCAGAAPGIKITALGDLFQDRLEASRDTLKQKLAPNQFQVTADSCFVGFDCYRKVIGSGKQQVAERVVGTKGVAYCDRGRIEGEKPYTYAGPEVNPYVQEHVDFIRSIRDGQPLNEGQRMAESNLTAIMGRLSAYTGLPVGWDWAANTSALDLSPPRYELGPLPVPPVAMPGRTELI